MLKCRLIEKMEIIMQHNFVPFLIMMGGMTVGFHYFSILSGIYSIMVAMGESQMEKFTMIKPKYRGFVCYACQQPGHFKVI